jgi:hypothetical protein
MFQGPEELLDLAEEAWEPVWYDSDSDANADADAKVIEVLSQLVEDEDNTGAASEYTSDQEETVTAMENAPLCESNDLIENQGAIQLSEDSSDKATKPWKNRERSPADAADFFKVGRMFSQFWHESVSNDRVSKRGEYCEPVNSETRRMVVVRENDGNYWAVPIHLYEREAKVKHQHYLHSHAIMH